MNISIWIKVIVIAFIVVTFGFVFYGRKTGLINERSIKTLEKIVSGSLLIIAIITFFINLYVDKSPSRLSQSSTFGILGLAIIINSRRAFSRK